MQWISTKAQAGTTAPLTPFMRITNIWTAIFNDSMVNLSDTTCTFSEDGQSLTFYHSKTQSKRGQKTELLHLRQFKEATHSLVSCIKKQIDDFYAIFGLKTPSLFGLDA